MGRRREQGREGGHRLTWSLEQTRQDDGDEITSTEKDTDPIIIPQTQSLRSSRRPHICRCYFEEPNKVGGSICWPLAFILVPSSPPSPPPIPHTLLKHVFRLMAKLESRKIFWLKLRLPAPCLDVMGQTWRADWQVAGGLRFWPLRLPPTVTGLGAWC